MTSAHDWSGCQPGPTRDSTSERRVGVEDVNAYLSDLARLQSGRERPLVEVVQRPHQRQQSDQHE